MDRISPDRSSWDNSRPIPGRQRDLSPFSFTASDDPRSSSMQSLVPSPSEYEESGRRKLLVIYIHGFMGNDASFQSFPAHVHRYLKLALSETHTIHSKIYPRYKTYKAIDVARDNFSRWLAPHESPTTDVVLVGHSMGGLLAADIAMIPSRNQHQTGYFLHRILGTVHLDAPLLGLHPSVITAGLASLFRPKSDTADSPGKPTPDDSLSQSLSNLTGESASIYSDPSGASQVSLPSPKPIGIPGSHGITFDPNFNPTFTNDVRIQDRSWWKNIVHFVEKHSSEGLVDAATHHIMSHLEFGGCLLDASNLRTRYENIRRLEDIDDLKHHGFPHVPPQVRFIQYYTVCHGYPKKPKDGGSNPNAGIPQTLQDIHSPSSTSCISDQRESDPPNDQGSVSAGSEKNGLPQNTFDTDSDGDSSLQLLPPDPIPEEPSAESDHSTPDQLSKGTKNDFSGDTTLATHPSGETEMGTSPQQDRKSSLSRETQENDIPAATDLTDAVTSLYLDLPEVPELPVKPDPPDLDKYADKDARKQAEKEAKRLQKDYDRLVKERDKAIKDRQKVVDKRKKKLTQEAEKREREEQKRRRKGEVSFGTSGCPNLGDGNVLEFQGTRPVSIVGPQKSQATSDYNVSPPPPSSLEQPRANAKPPKQPKERKFCNLPSKVNGQVDPKWVKIFMKDMDQVAAHTSLFFGGEHYERLVGDVGQTIVNWVQDDMTKRTILEMG